MKSTLLTICISLGLWVGMSGKSVFAQSSSTSLPTSTSEVANLIHKVNGYWQNLNPNPGWAFWDHAAYHTGNMEAYKITGTEAYKNYSEVWAVQNQWMGARSTNKANWKYTYGETNDYVLFGDWQICFQTYIDLYNLDQVKDPIKIARAREVMEYQMSTARNDYWWWADGLYMVMPVMTKLYKVTGNQQYLDKLYEYLSYSNSIMYDAEEKLYYRDAKYVYPQHKTASGKKDFWARGNGWVFAGFAKVFQDLPETDPHRAEYVQRFKDMAQALASSQQAEGYWTRSIQDPDQAPGRETSGTAFFTYGLLWGINNGLLEKDIYLPVAAKGWNYLTTVALHPNGRVGYVQPIGERAIPGQVVDFNSTTNFGVGAFLLAASEMHRYVVKSSAVTGVKEEALAKKVAVFPNPAVSEVTVQLPTGVDCQNITLKNMLGKTAASFSGNYTGETLLKLNQLRKGPYLLQLQTNKGVLSKKLIIH